jgi:branched-chain amino acid transport system permease protein
LIEYFLLLYRIIRGELLAKPGRVIAVVFFTSLILVPLITAHPFIFRLIIFAAMFAIFAASWDLLAGFTGQVSLGHAIFFGTGAYIVALTNKNLGLPPWVTIPAGGFAAVLMAFIIGMPVMRLRGFYLSLVTLAFPIILHGIVFAFPDFTGGELGIFGLDPLSDSRTLSYYIIILIMIGSVLIMWKLTDSKSKIIRIGIIFVSIREDEITTRTSGINTVKYKLLAFAISGFFAGIAGGLYAHFLRGTGPSTLQFMTSFQIILWTIFGGISTIYGAVVGVFVLYPFIDVLSLHPVGEEIRFAIFALLLMFTLLFMPEGLSTWVRDKIEINCPRCKLINVITRRSCRACGAFLHLERKKI